MKINITLTTCNPIIIQFFVRGVTIMGFTSGAVRITWEILMCLFLWLLFSVPFFTSFCDFLVCLGWPPTHFFDDFGFGVFLRVAFPFKRLASLASTSARCALLVEANETRCARPDLVVLRCHLGTGKRLQKKFSATLGIFPFAVVSAMGIVMVGGIANNCLSAHQSQQKQLKMCSTWKMQALLKWM